MASAAKWTVRRAIALYQQQQQQQRQRRHDGGRSPEALMRNAVASLTLSNRCRRSRSVLAASDRLIVLSPVNTKPHHIPLALSLAAIRCYIVHLVTPKSPRLRNPTQLRDISKFARIQINNFPTERTSVYVAETTCNKKICNENVGLRTHVHTNTTWLYRMRQKSWPRAYFKALCFSQYLE